MNENGMKKAINKNGMKNNKLMNEDGMKKNV